MKINVEKLTKGIIQETVKTGIKRIAADITDTDKMSNAKRELTIKVLFKPDIESSKVDVSVESFEKLAKSRAEKMTMHVAKKDGQPVASEKEIGQIYFDDLEEVNNND